LEQSIEPWVANFARQQQGARVLLKQMENPEHLSHLGVPELQQGRITHIHEKPAEPPSPYAVIGVYLYDPSVFEIIKTLKPSGRGELEITDVNNAYVERGLMEHDVISGWWGDAGESIDAYLEAFNFVAGNGFDTSHERGSR